jgi:hypothetical protein
MNHDEFRAVAYRLGHHFAERLLRAGKDHEAIRLAMRDAQERLKSLRAYSATLDAMKRLGVEDALAGKPIDRRYAAPGESRGGAGHRH